MMFKAQFYQTISASIGGSSLNKNVEDIGSSFFLALSRFQGDTKSQSFKVNP